MTKGKQMSSFYKRYSVYSLLCCIILIIASVVITIQVNQVGREWIIFFCCFFVLTLLQIFTTLYYYSMQQTLNFVIMVLLQTAFLITLFFFDDIRASFFPFCTSIAFQTRGTIVHNYIIMGGIVYVIGFVLLQSILFGSDQDELNNI